MIAPAPFAGQGPLALPVIHRDLEHHYVFAVARIDTGYVLYAGPSLLRAAMSLDPGTCYAAAESEGTALTLVWELARWFRDRQATRPKGRPSCEAPRD